MLSSWGHYWPFYRPQRSCGKVIFLHLSVILFTGRVWQTRIDTPWEDTPPEQTPPKRWALQRTVRILLECILYFLKKKFWGRHQSFLWDHRSQGGSLARLQWIAQIHLWCNTFWCLNGQHCSWALLIHILPRTHKHRWDSNIHKCISWYVSCTKAWGGGGSTLFDH